MYLLDADIFITAKNTYYAFDLCPGFWESLLHHHERRRVYSIEPVRRELLPASSRPDELALWVRDEVPDGFFLERDSDAIVDAYGEIQAWAQASSQYSDAAKQEFAKGADAWLVAFGRALGATVVTNETPDPQARKRIKIPDACNHFSVPFTDPFSMLKDLRVRFEWVGGGEEPQP